MCEASTRTSRAGPSTVRVWISTPAGTYARAAGSSPEARFSCGRAGTRRFRTPGAARPVRPPGAPRAAGLGGGEAYGRRVFADAHDDPAAHRRHRLVVVAAAQHHHRAAGPRGDTQGDRAEQYPGNAARPRVPTTSKDAERAARISAHSGSSGASSSSTRRPGRRMCTRRAATARTSPAGGGGTVAPGPGCRSAGAACTSRSGTPRRSASSAAQSTARRLGADPSTPTTSGQEGPGSVMAVSRARRRRRGRWRGASPRG